jgi:MFS family permease
MTRGSLRALGREIGDGVRFVVAHPVLRPLTAGWALYYFAFFLFWGQYPLYVTGDLGLAPAAFGVIGSLSAVAGVLGAVATNPVTARWGLGRTMTGAVLVGALGTLLLPLAGGPALAAAAVLVLAEGLLRATDQFFWINYTSVCQALTPDRLRGRVNASVRVCSAGTVPVAALLGGAIGEAIGLRATAAVAGVGVLLAFGLLALSPVRSLRTLPDEGSASEPVSGHDGAEPPLLAASSPRRRLASAAGPARDS